MSNTERALALKNYERYYNEEFYRYYLDKKEVSAQVHDYIEDLFRQAQLYQKYRIGPWHQLDMVKLAAVQLYVERKNDGRQLVFCGFYEDELYSHTKTGPTGSTKVEEFRQAMNWLRDSLHGLNQDELRMVPLDIDIRSNEAMSKPIPRQKRDPFIQI